MKKILAYRFSAFGDVAMIVPVLKEFLAQNPDTEIVFVSRKNFVDLCDGVERLIFRGVNLDDYKGFFGLRKLALELKKEFQPDFVADLHNVLRTKILSFFFKKTATLDKGRTDKKLLTRKENKVKKPLKPTTERYAAGLSPGLMYGGGGDRKSTRLNSSHRSLSLMPSSA